MTVGVVVGEQAPLQHLVRAETGDMVFGECPLPIESPYLGKTWQHGIPGLNAGHEVCGGECELLHLGEVVGGVPVQGQLAHRHQGELIVRPHLGQCVVDRYCLIDVSTIYHGLPW